MTIIGIALAALAAVRLYRNHRVRTNTTGATVTDALSHVRQSTSVVLAVADAVWTVLDALMFLTKPRTGLSGTSTTPLRPASTQFGSRLAADVVVAG